MIVKLINSVAKSISHIAINTSNYLNVFFYVSNYLNETAVNNDPIVGDKLKVVFLENYRVSLAEKG